MNDTRESWLARAGDAMAIWFAAAGYEVPRQIRYSCGWPSVGGLARGRRRIGECWGTRCSADGHYEIFISPWLGKAPEVLATLLHEMVHAVVGLEHGHKGPFAKCAKRMGLDGKMTATSAGAELAERLNALASRLGGYPHGRIEGLASDRPKKQGTRMRKVICPSCGYLVRTTARWLEVGVPTCPCGEAMVAEDGGDEEDGAE